MVGAAARAGIVVNAALVLLASVVAAAPPMVFAVIGETISERAGVINLSLDGSLLLSALAAFAVASLTGSLVAGFAAGALVGAAMAAVVAVGSLTLKQSQVAVGFVLTLLARDLAYSIGGAYAHVPGPQVPHAAIPVLARLPGLGPVLFDQNLVVYASLATIGVAWAIMFRTRAGLGLRAVGERPAAAFARGINVMRVRYVCTLTGGALTGVGGAAFSLLVKPGWARPYGIEGTGWIALAIVIFGGWRPARAAAGAYAFVALQTLAPALQGAVPGLPAQLLTALPFPAMILALLLVGVGRADWVRRRLAALPVGTRSRAARLLRALDVSPPAALGSVGDRD
jgi:ABC-type uncharacterized transport system permease subunit